MSNSYQIGGWFYPSAPCWPRLDLIQSKHPNITQLCGEFLRFTTTVQPDGSCIEVMTEQEYGIGGYTPENVQKLINSVPEPYCTVSGRSESGVAKMLHDSNIQNKTIQKIVQFCKNNKLHCDMNIEGLASFSAEECEKHASFLNELGEALKEMN